MPNVRPPVDQIALTKARYDALGYPAYEWVRNEEAPPFVGLTKPVNQSRVTLIASGGIYVKGQPAFHHKDDTSVRIIDRDTATADLRASHFAYDLTDARADPNVVFPIDTLRALAAEGVIGEFAKRAYAFMGGIYSARRVRELLAPLLLDRLKRDDTELALLVPV